MEYGVYRLDRSPENIEKNFRCVLPLIKTLLTPEDYDSLGEGETLDNLIAVYRRIIRVQNYRHRLNDFYDRFYTSRGEMRMTENAQIQERFYGAYGFTTMDLEELLAADLGFTGENEDYWNGSLSFWMWRNQEKNMDMVYKILLKVHKEYQNQ